MNPSLPFPLLCISPFHLSSHLYFRFHLVKMDSVYILFYDHNLVLCASLKITSLIYFRLCWVSVAERAFSRCGGWGSSPFATCRLLSPRLLWLQGTGSGVPGLSSCSSQALGHRINNCGPWVWLFYSVWDLPRPGIELMSPTLAGRFSTTEQPGKTLCAFCIAWFKQFKISQLCFHHNELCNY